MSTRFYAGQSDYIVQFNLMDDQLQTGTVNNAAKITVNVDDATNANFFPLFVSSGGSGITPADSSKFMYNPFTGAVTAVTFIGALSGTATNATNVGVTNDTATNATYFPVFVTSNVGNLPLKLSNTKLTYNPSTGTLAATVFSGSATGINVTTDNATATVTYPIFSASGTANQAPKNSNNLSYVPNTGLLTSFAYRANGTGGMGYATGAGGTVAQATSKATGVTLNKACGDITMFATDSIAADTSVAFTLTNSSIAATDILIVAHQSGGTAGAYTLTAQCAAGSATITVRNISTGALAETPVIRFAVLKSVTA